MRERVRRRVTWRLMPFLMFIYLLAYLDRANVGVAKLGMQRALGFDDAVIGFGSGIFFIGFLIMDIPGSLLVERWSARKWMARIMVTWGLVATAMGFLGMVAAGGLSLERQFYALRLLLGIAEAGFFPGAIVYLSHWYCAADRPRAKAWFILAQPLAVALGIPASRWILDHVAWSGLEGWRWVFILEGLAPVLMGFVTLFYLTDRPHQAKWLAAGEREWLTRELEAENQRKAGAARMSIADALRFPQTFMLLAIYFLIVTGNQALIFFLPSITENLRDLPVEARTLAAAAPYACSAIGILTNGYWAQRTGALNWHTAIPPIATAISLSLTVAVGGGHPLLLVALFCLAGLTSQAYLPPFFTLPTLLFGQSAAAAAVGLICLGNLGGFFGPWLFGALKTSTGSYDTGILLLAGCMVLAGLLATRIRVPET